MSHGSRRREIVSAGLVGYALSLIPFRGRSLINNAILFHMFFPAIILLVPTFLIVRYAGLYNTYGGMIIPTAMSVWAIFMYSSFFRSVSAEMIEAARIDGASELAIIFRIIVPVSLPITAVRAAEATQVVTPIWLDADNGRVTPGGVRDALTSTTMAVLVSAVRERRARGDVEVPPKD